MTPEQLRSIAEIVAVLGSVLGSIVAIIVAVSTRRESRATASEKVVQAAKTLLEPMEQEIDRLKRDMVLLDLRHARDERQIEQLTRLLFIGVNYIDDLREMLEGMGVMPPPVPEEISRWLDLMEHQYNNKDEE